MIKLKKQEEYCEKNNLPFFAPDNGICSCCHRKIEDNGEKLITSCDYCNRSYVD